MTGKCQRICSDSQASHCSFFNCFYIMKSEHLHLTQAGWTQLSWRMSALNFSACEGFFFPCFTSPKGQRSNLFSCRWGHPCWWTAADHNKNRVSHVTSPPHLGAVMSSLSRHDETCLKHVLKYINFLLISPWPFMCFNTTINLFTISNKKKTNNIYGIYVFYT